MQCNLNCSWFFNPDFFYKMRAKKDRRQHEEGLELHEWAGLKIKICLFENMAFHSIIGKSKKGENSYVSSWWDEWLKKCLQLPKSSFAVLGQWSQTQSEVWMLISKTLISSHGRILNTRMECMMVWDMIFKLETLHRFMKQGHPHLSRKILYTKNKGHLQFLYSGLLEYFLRLKH